MVTLSRRSPIVNDPRDRAIIGARVASGETRAAGVDGAGVTIPATFAWERPSIGTTLCVRSEAKNRGSPTHLGVGPGSECERPYAQARYDMGRTLAFSLKLVRAYARTLRFPAAHERHIDRELAGLGERRLELCGAYRDVRVEVLHVPNQDTVPLPSDRRVRVSHRRGAAIEDLHLAPHVTHDHDPSVVRLRLELASIRARPLDDEGLRVAPFDGAKDLALRVELRRRGEHRRDIAAAARRKDEADEQEEVAVPHREEPYLGFR
jgi:hypothetical protein